MSKGTGKKRGCLYAFLIGLAILVVIVVYSIIMVNKVAEIYGVSVKVFKDYMNLLNKTVNESNLVNYPVTSGDYDSFVTKSNAAGFAIFDDDGNVDLSKVNIYLQSNLSLTGAEAGAMLNNGFANGADYNELQVLQLSFDVGRITTLTSVVCIDLTEAKKATGGFFKELPNNIYLTCESEVTITGSRIFVIESSLRINELSNNDNQAITELLSKMFDDSQSGFKFNDINNTLISNALTDVARASGCDVLISQNAIAFNLVN